MSFLTSIIAKLKGMWAKMLGSKTIEQVLSITPVMSPEMEHAIQQWSDLYRNKAPWLHEPDRDNPIRIVSLGLPAMIASEKARMAVLEMNSEITTPTKEVEVDNPNYKEPEPDQFGNIIPTFEPKTIIQDEPITKTERAEFLNQQYSKLKENLRRQLEYGIAKGGFVIKPYVVQGEVDETTNQVTYKIEFDYIQADCFYPISFNASGEITEAAFLDTKTDKNTIYRRLEYHQWKNNSVRVINKAFKSNIPVNSTIDLNNIDLGKEISLTDVPEWSGLQPDTTIKNVSKPLFAYFKMPEANTIDTSSPLGVSGFSRAVSLIKDADMQYSALLWEYEGGQLAIDIDRDALKTTTDSQGNPHTQQALFQERLFRLVDISQTGETYQPYAPSLRDNNYTAGLNTILMRIEDVCQLSRGTISDATSEAKTATELKILKQRSYSANAEIQHALENTLKDVVYIMNVYCDLYEITEDGDYDVNFEWDDSILVDVDTELGKQITLLQNGLTSKKDVIKWYFGMTDRQAEDKLKEIEGESAADMEKELAMQSNLAMQNREE